RQREARHRSPRRRRDRRGRAHGARPRRRAPESPRLRRPLRASPERPKKRMLQDPPWLALHAFHDRGELVLSVSDTSLAALSHTIQVAIAPVFLLTGIGSMLGVLTSRLGRIVDRVRFLESSPTTAVRLSEGAVRIELMRLMERKRWVNRAIMLCTFCALLICTLIAAVFVGVFVRVEIGAFVALV